MGRKKKSTQQGQKPQEDEGETSEQQGTSESNTDTNATPGNDNQNVESTKVSCELQSNASGMGEESKQIQLQKQQEGQNLNNETRAQTEKTYNLKQAIENRTQPEQKPKDVTTVVHKETPSNGQLVPQQQQQIQLQGDQKPPAVQQQHQMENQKDQKGIPKQHQTQGERKMLTEQQLQQERQKLSPEKQQQEQLQIDQKIMPQPQQHEHHEIHRTEHEIQKERREQTQQEGKNQVGETQSIQKKDQIQPIKEIRVKSKEHKQPQWQEQSKKVAETGGNHQQKQTHTSQEIVVSHGQKEKLQNEHNIPLQQQQKETHEVGGGNLSNKELEKEVKKEHQEEREELTQQQAKLNQQLQSSDKELKRQPQQIHQKQQLKGKPKEPVQKQDQTQLKQNILTEQLESKQKQTHQKQEHELEHAEQKHANLDENVQTDRKEPQPQQQKQYDAEYESSDKQQQNEKQKQELQVKNETILKQRLQTQESYESPVEQKQTTQQQLTQQNQGINVNQNGPKQQQQYSQQKRQVPSEELQQKDTKNDHLGEQQLHLQKHESCQSSQNETQLKQEKQLEEWPKEKYQMNQEPQEKLLKVEQRIEQECIQLVKTEHSKQDQQQAPQNLNSLQQQLPPQADKKTQEEKLPKTEEKKTLQQQDQQTIKQEKQQITRKQDRSEKKKQQKSQQQGKKTQVQSQDNIDMEKQQAEDNQEQLKAKQESSPSLPLPEQKQSRQPQKRTVQQQQTAQTIDVIHQQNEEKQSEHKEQEHPEHLEKKPRDKSPLNEQQKEQKHEAKQKLQQKTGQEKLQKNQKTEKKQNHLPENKQQSKHQNDQTNMINQEKLQEISEQPKQNPEQSPEELKQTSQDTQKDPYKNQKKQPQDKQEKGRQAEKKPQVQQTKEQVHLKQQLQEHQDLQNTQQDTKKEEQQQHQEQQSSQSQSKKRLKKTKKEAQANGGVKSEHSCKIQTTSKQSKPGNVAPSQKDDASLNEEQISALSQIEATHGEAQCSSLQELARKSLNNAGITATTNAAIQSEGKASGKKKRSRVQRNSATNENSHDSQSLVHGGTAKQKQDIGKVNDKAKKVSRVTTTTNTESTHPECNTLEGSKDTASQGSEALQVDNMKKRRRRKKKNQNSQSSEQIANNEENVKSAVIANEANLCKSGSKKKPKHSKALDPNSPLSKALLLRAEEKLKNEIALANVSSSETSDRYFSEINKKLNILQRYRDEILSGKRTSNEGMANVDSVIDDDGDGDIQYQLIQRIVFLHYACHVCKALTGENNNPLKRCSSCKMISYCSQEHQKSHWTLHKDICKVICKLCKNYGLSHLFEKAVGLDAERYRHFRIHWVTECTRELGRELELWEKEMFFYPDVCHSCYQYDKVKLTTCDKCHHVSFCQPDHLNPNHETWCNDFKIYGDILRFQAQNGMINPALPTSISNTFKQLPINMEAHLSEILKDVSAIDPLTSAILTDIATCPLTALFALERFYPSLADLQTLTIHLVGAEMYFEGDKMEKWETFLLHFLPSLLVLKIVLIGPELRTDFVPKKNISGVKCCDQCSTRGRSIEVSFFPGELYHEYVLSGKRSIPNLICAMNAGLYRSTGFEGRDTWPPSIRAMLAEPYCPIVITAYTAHELPLDVKRVQEHGKVEVIVPPMKNPYSSHKPSLNFVSEETAPLIFKNYYITLLQGLKRD